MWQDEVYYDDDDAAMAAYEEAVGRPAASDNDDDDDFALAPSGRSGSRSSRPPRPSVARGRKAAGPRKPRARRPSPAAASSGVESQSDAGNGSQPSAIPTPDIGQLTVASSVGGGSPAATAMDTDEGGDAPAVLMALRAREQDIRSRMAQLEKEIAELEKKCGVDPADGHAAADPVDLEEFRAPEWSVPIRANVMNF
ncbi:hypothetical protein H4R19_002808, partial [Coemansia spiralis]